MKPQYTKRSSIQGERGLYIVAMALFFFVLLAVVGIALDSGNIQRYQLRVQRAVDAAAIAATELLKTETVAVVQDIANKIVQDNFTRSGMEFDPAVDPDAIQIMLLNKDGNPIGAGEPARIVRVFARVPVPVYVLNLAPFIYQAPVVSAVAEASDVRLVVSVAIDTSGSMCNNQHPECCEDAEGNDHPNCELNLDFVPDPGETKFPPNCYVPDGTLPCSKFVDSKIAIQNFITQFTEDDRIGLVEYDQGSGQLYPSGSLNMEYMTSSNQYAAQHAIAGLRFGSGTNFVAALTKARDQINTQSDIGDNDLKAIVLITDGVPTRGPQIPSSSCTNTEIGGDFDPIDEYTGPHGYGTSYERQKRRQALESILVSHSIRTQGILIFTIGMGRIGEPYGDPLATGNFASGNTPNPADTVGGYNPDDPFMVHTKNARESIVASTLLAVISNDQAFLQAKPTPTPGGTPNPSPTPTKLPDFPCVPTNAQAASLGYEGKVYQTDDTGEVGNILSEIGETIRYRLSK